ncbi:MAG: DNA repair protein RecN [Gammaproteobacteria bacterium]
MLERLIIQNFKLVEEVDLDLGNGLAVITGETGAGKSSLIQALALAVGGRVSDKPLRPGCSKGEVQCWFNLADCSEAVDWLQARDLCNEDRNRCVLRRTFTEDGRSRAHINGSACLIGELADLGALLVDLIAQNQHHSLLQLSAQQQLLDSSWQSQHILSTLADGYQSIHQLQMQLQQLESLNAQADMRCQFLSQQLEALSKLELAEGTFEEIEAEYRRLASSGDLLAGLDQVEIFLQGEQQSASSQLSKAIRKLSDLQAVASDPDGALRTVQSSLETASVLIDEAAADVRRLAFGSDQNPEKLAHLEHRIASCHELAKRHGCAPDALWKLTDAFQEELFELENAEERLVQLKKQLGAEQEAWNRQALQVSSERKQAATQLAEKTNQGLEQLGMGGAEFRIDLEPSSASALGLESAVFRYSPARLVPAGAIGKIASGGELSRLYLCLSLASRELHVASRKGPPVLVLDEVDIGVGGETAHQLAALIRSLGEEKQVFCVTHLPQIAAVGHQHLSVTRTMDDHPVLSARLLGMTERTGEVARMLAGGRAGKESMDLAEKLILAVR